MYYTYIIYSKSADQYYTGYTSQTIQKRLDRHNAGSSSSTKAGIPWTIKYVKSFTNKSEAIKWENVIKRQKSRDFIERLIDSEEIKRKEPGGRAPYEYFLKKVVIPWG